MAGLDVAGIAARAAELEASGMNRAEALAMATREQRQSVADARTRFQQEQSEAQLEINRRAREGSDIREGEKRRFTEGLRTSGELEVARGQPPRSTALPQVPATGEDPGGLTIQQLQEQGLLEPLPEVPPVLPPAGEPGTSTERRGGQKQRDVEQQFRRQDLLRLLEEELQRRGTPAPAAAVENR